MNSELTSARTATLREMAAAGAPTQTISGSPVDALRNVTFRRVFFGTFASNIGTWMQNVTLIVLADRLTGQAAFVGTITFAQLGPMLIATPVGGVLADRINRKTIMVTSLIVQALLSTALAWCALAASPSKTAIVGIVLGIGIAGALGSPAAQATVPHLVGPENLAAAISLNSAQMNASRVIGPLLAAIPLISAPSTVFFLNAGTYLFAIGAIMSVTFGPTSLADAPRQKILDGFRAVRADRTIRLVIGTVAVYSLCSLSFIYHMKGFARVHLHLSDQAYNWLFASFGTGAALGALVVGIFAREANSYTVVRWSLLAFALMLSGFALSSGTLLPFVFVAACGGTYFSAITALSTLLQRQLAPDIRGRVMSVWMMAWAGMVPIGAMIAGLMIDWAGHRSVFLVGAGVAAACALNFRMRDTTPNHSHTTR